MKSLYPGTLLLSESHIELFGCSMTHQKEQHPLILNCKNNGIGFVV